MSSTYHYRQMSFPLLPLPRVLVPFHVQAHPLPDPLQRHFTFEQREVINSAYNRSNKLATERFLGTKWSQDNEPKYLGANERIVFEDSW